MLWFQVLNLTWLALEKCWYFLGALERVISHLNNLEKKNNLLAHSKSPVKEVWRSATLALSYVMILFFWVLLKLFLFSTTSFHESTMSWSYSIRGVSPHLMVVLKRETSGHFIAFVLGKFNFHLSSCTWAVFSSQKKGGSWSSYTL